MTTRPTSRLDISPADGVLHGHDKADQPAERKPGVLATQIQTYFEFREDWYRGDEVAGLVYEYYVLLRSVLRTKPHLRGCVKRCRECGIFFPTHPRNAGRRDLRCPFGCRQSHVKQCSTRRSVDYYREHKVKKSMQNGKRNQSPSVDADTAKPAPEEPSVGAEPTGYDAKMVEHVRMVTSMIEGRTVSRAEVLKMLDRAKKMRQQGIGRSDEPGYRTRESEKDSS